VVMQRRHKHPIQGLGKPISRLSRFARTGIRATAGVTSE
jgi:hypothetical protein